MLRAFHKNDRKMNLRGEAGQPNLLWLLGSPSGIFRIPLDAALIAKNFAPPCTRQTLHGAARALGIKTGGCPVTDRDWQKVPLPAIAFLPLFDSSPAPTGVPSSDAPRPADDQPIEPAASGPTPMADPLHIVDKAIKGVTCPWTPGYLTLNPFGRG